MRISLSIAGAILLASTPVLAQDAAAPAAVAQIRAGKVLRDVNAVRLGSIDRVNADGSVKIIFESRFVTVPADTLTVVDGGAVTSLSKKDVRKLR